MTLNVKTLTGLAIATLMTGMAIWATVRLMIPSSERVVGVVEVGEIQ